MTMDVHPRSRAEPSAQFLSERGRGAAASPTAAEPPAAAAPPKPAKRSFDVAFLMAPDDPAAKRRQQQQQLRVVSSTSLMHRYSPPAAAAHADELLISRVLQQRALPRHFGAYADPTSPLGLLIPAPKNEPKEIIDITQDEQSLRFAKSAFTKVKSARFDGGAGVNTSPSSVSSTVSGGVSPDVAYQESLSPPAGGRSPMRYLQSKMAPGVTYFAGKGLPQMSPQYLYVQAKEKAEGKAASASPLGPNGMLGSLIGKVPPDLQKLRPALYQAEGLPYGGLSPYPFPANFPASAAPVPPHAHAHSLLTAASVTAALLPSSLAALTLPAQNVCAKCKISFRMTSDLVYHMRSHHKGEHVTADAVRRRRELDKLRCPVCNETFRERHHLTRHMTAHQDKEGDRDDDEDALELARRRK